MYMCIPLTAMILMCIQRDCWESLASSTLNDLADAERSEWRWRLTRERIDVPDAKRKKSFCGVLRAPSAYTSPLMHILHFMLLRIIDCIIDLHIHDFYIAYSSYSAHVITIMSTVRSMNLR